MAKSDGANTPTDQEWSFFLLLRKAGDALEAASPPFDAAAGATRLRTAALAYGLLRPDATPEEDLAVTDANLEEEAPPFDVDAGAARLRKAARDHGLLASRALEAVGEAASSHSLRAVPATSRPDTDMSAEEIGYRGPTACAAAGITYNQLDYWARTGLVEPSVRAAHGSGSQRLYSFRDILVLKVVKRLLDTGISLQQIRVAVQHLRDRGSADLAQVTLMSDGVSVYECTSTDEVVDLLQGGLGVFGIALGRVWREVEGDLAVLPAVRAEDGFVAVASGTTVQTKEEKSSWNRVAR
jgi:DNA-binding transcriptional MerR regulator